LHENQPAVIVDFIDWVNRRIYDVMVVANAKPEGSKATPHGDPLETQIVDPASIDAVLADLRQRQAAAGELALQDLSDVELRRRITALRERPLPEIRKLRYTRETPQANWQEA
jgi:hypothetical protein